MSVTRESFGFMPDGAEIYQYVIENESGSCVKVLTLGATVRSVVVPDKNGTLRDVALGFDTVEDYLTKSDYQGATVGPYCNRIAGASMPIDGKVYELVANEKDVTNLHSGGEFSFAVWSAIVTDADSVEMTYVSPDGEGGFPGETTAKVTFRLTEDDRFELRFDAASTRKTYLNLTNHAYFDLEGFDHGTVLDHSLQLMADRFTAVDALSIPTGENLPVAGTPFDFTSPRVIGERIDDDDEQLRMTGGYDHNFCITGWDGSLRLCAAAAAPESGIRMNVYTTLPGVQFYAGNFLSGTPGKNGVPMNRRSGFCLETQYYPDTPHREAFPSCLFAAGDHYTSQTVYAFSAEKSEEV